MLLNTLIIHNRDNLRWTMGVQGRCLKDGSRYTALVNIGATTTPLLELVFSYRRRASARRTEAVTSRTLFYTCAQVRDVRRRRTGVVNGEREGRKREGQHT